LAPPVIDKVPVTKPEAPFVKDVPEELAVAIANAPGWPDKFWIVPELLIWMALLSEIALMALVAPWIVPESTSIVVVPLPTVVVEMPLPKPVVTSAATVTAMLPRSALKASIPSRAVAPVTVIGAVDVTDTSPFPKLKA
jgi:hypothetical protein